MIVLAMKREMERERGDGMNAASLSGEYPFLNGRRRRGHMLCPHRIAGSDIKIWIYAMPCVYGV